MLRRMLPRALMGALVFLWLAMAGAAGEIYYQQVDVANRSDRPYSSIRLITCDVYLHLDEFGSQVKTADCVYFSPDAQPSLDAPGDTFLFDAWPDEQNPMALDSCEIWELPAGGPGGEGSMVLLALHWQSRDGTVNYVSDLAVSVDCEGGWSLDRMELHDGIFMEHEGSLWTVTMGDIKSAAWKAEMELGDKPANADIQRVMDSYGKATIRLEDGQQLEEDRRYTWSRGYTGLFDATCGLYQTLDDVHAPFEDQLSYRLGRALYDTKTHRQVGTVYSRVTMYETLMVVCEVEDIVWLQSDAEDHSGWRLQVLRESDDVIPPDAPLYMAAVVEDENGEIQTAYSEGITWTLADPETGTLAPFSQADSWLGAVTAGYSRMKLTPLIDAGQVTLTVRHDGLGLQEKLTLQVYRDPFLYRYNDTELIASVVGYTGDRSEGVVIPSTTVKNGRTYRVEAIDESAFEGMGFPWVALPDSLEWICKDAFRNCDGLTSVNLTHVQGVEAGAFSSCDSLKEVFIGSSVTILEDGVFADCSSLTAFHCDEKNENFRVDEESGSLEQVLSSERAGNYIWREVRLVCVPAGRNHRDLTLPYEVTEISPSAFSGCTGLGDVTIANPDTSLASVRFDLTGPSLRLLVYQDSRAEQDAIARGLNHARIFDWDSDRVRFLNQDDDFFSKQDKGPHPYEISREKLNALCEGMSPVARLATQAAAFRKWSGSCSGMSRAALIHRYVRLENDRRQMELMEDNLTTGNYYQMPYPRDNSTVKEYINYYQLMQCLPDPLNVALQAFEDVPWKKADDYRQSDLSAEIAASAIGALQQGIPIYVALKNHAVIFERITSVRDGKIHIQVYNPNTKDSEEAVWSQDGLEFSFGDYHFVRETFYAWDDIDLKNYFTNEASKPLTTDYYTDTAFVFIQKLMKTEIVKGHWTFPFDNKHEGEGYWTYPVVNRDNYESYLRFYDAQDTVYVVNAMEIPLSDGDAPQPLLLIDRPLPEQVTMAFAQGIAVSLLDARYPFTLEAEAAGRVAVDYAARSLSVQADAPGTLRLTLAPEEGDTPGGEFVEITAADASRLTAAWSSQGLTLSSDSPEPLAVVCLDGENAVETQVSASGGTVGPGGTAASGKGPTATPSASAAASGKGPTAAPPTGDTASGTGPTATPPTSAATHQADPDATQAQRYWLLLLLPAGGLLVLLVLLVVLAKRRNGTHKPAPSRPAGMEQASLAEPPASQHPAPSRPAGMEQASLAEPPAPQRPAPHHPGSMQQASLTEPPAPQHPAPSRPAGMEHASLTEPPAPQRPAPSRPAGMEQASLTEPPAPQRPAPPRRPAGLRPASFAEPPIPRPPEHPDNPPEPAPPREDG